MDLSTPTARIVTSTAIGVLAVTVASLGVATAANGGSLVLGHHNHATSTTTLTDHHGTPLSLVGKSSKPPLKVNSSKEVSHLNAALLGGQSATSLETAGSGVQIPYHDVLHTIQAISMDKNKATLLMSTAKLSPGMYYLIASANGFLSSGTAECFIGTNNNLDDGALQEEPTTTPAITLTLVAVTTITKPTTYGLYCDGTDADINQGGLVAVRIARNAPGQVAGKKK